MGAMNFNAQLLSYLCHTDYDLTAGRTHDTPLHHLVGVQRSQESNESLIGTLAREKPAVYGQMKNELLHHACRQGSAPTVKVFVQRIRTQIDGLIA